MLYHLLVPLSEGGDVFNLFRYITFRAGGAFMTALFMGFLFGRPIIAFLRRMQKNGQPIRNDGPERHLIEKAGTPTMGGVMILFAMLTASLLWVQLVYGFVWAVLLVPLGIGQLRYADDYLMIPCVSPRDC